MCGVWYFAGYFKVELSPNGGGLNVSCATTLLGPNECVSECRRVTRINDGAALPDTDAMTRTIRYTERLSFFIGTQVGPN